jgi:hypothetical protein
MRIAPSPNYGDVILVDDSFIEWEAWGWYYVFNLSNPDYWHCWLPPPDREYGGAIGLWTDMDATICWQDLPVVIIPPAGANWGAVKSLY